MDPQHVESLPLHAAAERRHRTPDFGLRLHDVDEEELQQAVIDGDRAPMGSREDSVGAEPGVEGRVVHEALVDVAGATKHEIAGRMGAVEELRDVLLTVAVAFLENRVWEREKRYVSRETRVYLRRMWCSPREEARGIE